MARTDPRLQVNVPQFVHDQLDALRNEVLAAQPGQDKPSEPRVIGALVHAADLDVVLAALAAYGPVERAFRELERDAVEAIGAFIAQAND